MYTTPRNLLGRFKLRNVRASTPDRKHLQQTTLPCACFSQLFSLHDSIGAYWCFFGGCPSSGLHEPLRGLSTPTKTVAHREGEGDKNSPKKSVASSKRPMWWQQNSSRPLGGHRTAKSEPHRTNTHKPPLCRQRDKETEAPKRHQQTTFATRRGQPRQSRIDNKRN